MNSSDSLEEYILRHIDEEPELLREIHRETHLKLLHGIMVSGHLQGRLLKMLVRMIHPSQVLEIGTYTGYSSLCIAEGLEEDARLHTIEIDDELEEMILRNFGRSSVANRITLHIGDAAALLPGFEDGFFDLAFLDGDKRNYWQIYEATLPKVKSGGFLLADNTLWHGKILEPTSSDRQTQGIQEFNERLTSDNRVEKVILPLRDGLTLIRKK
jgi:predicted O-methyltransferase YrrM